HVRDAAGAISAVLRSPLGVVAGRVFNVGSSDQNYRKIDLLEIIQQRAGRAEVSFVSVDEDPRDYKVSFDRIRSALDFVPPRRVAAGVDEIARAIESGVLGGGDLREWSNTGGVATSVATEPRTHPICVP